MGYESLRLNRLVKHQTEKICIVPMDHSLTMGPIEGLVDYVNMAKKIEDGGADGIILHKGAFKRVIENNLLNKTKAILHLSGSTTLGGNVDNKILVSDIEDALMLGADAVSLHANFGTEYDNCVLKQLGAVGSMCMKYNMPLLVMVYVKTQEKEKFVEKTLQAISIADNLGADMVKIPFVDCISLEQIVNKSILPILIAGGEKKHSIDVLLQTINEIREFDIKGVAIGRNVFQYEQPDVLVKVLKDLMNKNIDLYDALNQLEERMKN